jgi:3-isopropylmalate/(R)-2-methylmalate dehydratase small subunit
MRVWKYGDDINTDMLFPGKYTYSCSTPEEIRPHLLEDLDPEFAGNVQAGDLVFAGKNFGCGSSPSTRDFCSSSAPMPWMRTRRARKSDWIPKGAG